MLATAFAMVAAAALLGDATPTRAQEESTTSTADASSGGALAGVSFRDHGTFERAVINVRTADGEAPRFSSQHASGARVIRVSMPEVMRAERPDGVNPAAGAALGRYYAVRHPSAALGQDPSGGLFVDVHLREPIRSVRVLTLDDPARILVDVFPAEPGSAMAPPPAISSNVVTLSPRARTTVGPEAVSVTGYARPPGAQGVWRIKNANGRIVSRGAYSTNDWLEMWGFYAFDAPYPASLAGGRGTLEVGYASPADGSFSAGTSIPVSFR